MNIEARDVTVRYPGAPVDALAGVSMAAAPGSLTALAGPNGSGKSTLLRALVGEVTVSAGEATVDGRRVGEWPRRELAMRLGVVAQFESVAFPITVGQLVEMGRYPHVGALQPLGADDREAVGDALESCGLSELVRRDVSTLSGGEFQRARIARALCQRPDALLLDEPTASLDMRHEMEILELLRSSADRGLTVLVVTHSLDRAAQFADHISLLSDGRVAAEGAPRDVFSEEILSSVYGWPVRVDSDADSGAKRVTPLRVPR